MKASLKLQDDHHNHNHNHNQEQEQDHHHPSLLLRAKIPISIFNLPFLSHFSTTTTDPSQLSLSLSTNFSTGPSLKLSYATAASSSSAPPLTLTLKSGTGLFGSPNNSPLIISAHCSFNPSNPNNPNPTFSLFFKPQLGSFSLRKSTFSHSKSDVRSEPTNGHDGFDSNSFGFVPLERPTGGNEVSVEKTDKDSIFKGIQLVAGTQMPLAKKVALNFRWWVRFPEDFGMKPILGINKISIQRVDDVLKEDEKHKKSEGSDGELEMLKGMCFWMKRELNVLTKVNREIRSELEEMKVGHSAVNDGDAMDFGTVVRKKAMPSSTGFEQWRSKRNDAGEEIKNINRKEIKNINRKKEEKKNGSIAIDVENELQRAIKAAVASP